MENLCILDFDGTILNSTDAWNRIYCKFCKDRQLPILKSLLNAQKQSAFTDWIILIRDCYHLEIGFNEIMNLFNEIAIEVYNQIPPKEGFFDFINLIEKSYKLVIISKEASSLISSWLKTNNIEFVLEVLQDRIDQRKDMELFQGLLANYKIPTKKMIFIDDNLSHCIVSKKIGLYTIGINDEHSKIRQEEMEKSCDLYVNDFQEIIKYYLWKN